MLIYKSIVLNLKTLEEYLIFNKSILQINVLGLPRLIVSFCSLYSSLVKPRTLIFCCLCLSVHAFYLFALLHFSVMLIQKQKNYGKILNLIFNLEIRSEKLKG